MDTNATVSSVRNDLVRFATMTPPGSSFITLDRCVVIVAPPDVVKLAESGDPAVLDALLPLLRDHDRAFAAAAVLSAMTRHEGDLMDTYATTPDDWWNVLGKTAFDRWDAWLRDNRAKLVWDPDERYFRVTR